MSADFPGTTPWDWSELQDRTSQEQFARLAREGRLPEYPRAEYEDDLDAGWRATFERRRRKA